MDHGIQQRIRFTHCVTAEVWALLEGLTMAIDLGITHLNIEMDAKIVVDHCS